MEEQTINTITKEDLKVKTKAKLIEKLETRGFSCNSAINNANYEKELYYLQVELNKLQSWIKKNNKRVIIICEGRDASGKGGFIRRFMERVNPRFVRLVALNKPTDVERGQWYFQRYIKELANSGEIVLFDRSWYNRAVVEPVMGFCTKKQYEQHMYQVPEFEYMLTESGINIIKFWFSITKEEQSKRFHSRLTTELKKWKLSPVDRESQNMWDIYTEYKENMFSRTHTAYCPWTIIKTNRKKTARLESIRHILSLFDYDGKNESEIQIMPDPNVALRYHRSIFVD